MIKKSYNSEYTKEGKPKNYNCSKHGEIINIKCEECENILRKLNIRLKELWK